MSERDAIEAAIFKAFAAGLRRDGERVLREASVTITPRFDPTNEIHPSAVIGENVRLGRYNVIGAHAVLDGYKGEAGELVIGDCCRIGERVKILAGPGGCAIGDWCTLHEDVLILGEKRKAIGHNCWIGRGSILDSTGGLTLGNGVRIGCHTEVWSHVSSGEQIEGCTLLGEKPVRLEDECWLVGSCFVSPGVTVGRRAIVLARSLLTHDVGAGEVHAGAPARKTSMRFYQDVLPSERLGMMDGWMRRFVIDHGGEFFASYDQEGPWGVEVYRGGDEIHFVRHLQQAVDPEVTYCCLATKFYTKQLTRLERDVIAFLHGNRARFVPLGQERVE